VTCVSGWAVAAGAETASSAASRATGRMRARAHC